MELLREYVGALVNLYGMFHKEKLLEIYNEQNEEQISMDDIEALMVDESVMVPGTFAYPYGDYFAHEVIAMYDEFDEWFRKKGDKPYYVPNKAELLRYVDDFYFEKTKAYRNLYSYVGENFISNNTEELKDVCEQVFDNCHLDFDLQYTLNDLVRMGVKFSSEKQMKEVVDLIIDLSNNVRLWENNGHTPNEIARKFGGLNLRSVAEGSSVVGENVINFVERKKQNVGRNDPCPCGSGKKYKKCCLGKDE